MHLFRTPRHYAIRVSLLATFATFSALAGCGNVDGGTDGNNTVGTVKVVPSNVTPTIGATLSDVQIIQIVRSAGYKGNVGLAIDSLPTGITATFEPAVLGTEGTTSLLTLSANSTAVLGPKVLSIKATGANAPVDSIALNVTVVTGSIELVTAAADVRVAPGTTGSLPLVLTRQNGFAGAASLTVEGLPSGVTATFAPALLPNGSTASTLKLSVPAGTDVGASTLTVRARSNGVADRTVQVPLIIQAPAASDFALAATPASLSLVGGTSAQSLINVTRLGGFAGSVAFTLSGAPAGMTGVFAPNATASDTSTLTLSVTTAVVPGAYNLALTATEAVSGLSRTIPISVQVKPAPGITLKLFPDALSIAPNGFAQSGLIITRVGGFTGDFIMSATGLPTGVTLAFASDVVTGNATSLTLSAKSAVAAGVYNVVIKATAGSDSGTATLVLTVGTASIK